MASERLSLAISRLEKSLTRLECAPRADTGAPLSGEARAEAAAALAALDGLIGELRTGLGNESHG